MRAWSQVAPGVWRIRLPFTGSPLDHVNVYVVEIGGSRILVDAGPPAADAESVLREALAAAGIATLGGVVLTHGHFDHCGLVDAAQSIGDAWVAGHAADEWLMSSERDAVERSRVAWLRRVGVPEAAARSVELALARLPKPRPAHARRPLTGGDALAFGTESLSVIHTPGHSPGSVCLHLPDRGVLFTGDHLLPTITPLIALWGEAGNPLREYLDSLRTLSELAPAPVLALPGHEESFEDVRERALAVVEHHEGRLDEICTRAEAPEIGDVWSLAERTTWSTPWEALGPLDRFCAVGEVAAHVRELAVRGALSSAREAELLAEAA
jgi:glyoxylase-like metal-dependent hydrolase (beta-lactamase superfamily II)